MRLDETVLLVVLRLFVRTGLAEYELAVKPVVQLVHLHAQGRPEKQIDWLNSFVIVTVEKARLGVPILKALSQSSVLPCLKSVLEIVHKVNSFKLQLHGASVGTARQYSMCSVRVTCMSPAAPAWVYESRHPVSESRDGPWRVSLLVTSSMRVNLPEAEYVCCGCSHTWDNGRAQSSALGQCTSHATEYPSHGPAHAQNRLCMQWMSTSMSSHLEVRRMRVHCITIGLPSVPCGCETLRDSACEDEDSSRDLVQCGTARSTLFWKRVLID